MVHEPSRVATLRLKTTRLEKRRHSTMGVGRIFSREGGTRGFFRNFSRGGKMWNLFFPTRNQGNNLFLLKFSKSKGDGPFRRSCIPHSLANPPEICFCRSVPY